MDVNYQTSVGPSGVAAVNSRIVAQRLVNTAQDSIEYLTQRGTLRCCNCGLAVLESMKLPVRDPYDSVKPSVGALAGAWPRDYIRIPLDWDEQRARSQMEFSEHVACIPGCALSYMYDSPDFVQSHVPDLFMKMMWLRHRIDEPVNRAPPADCLAYVYRTIRGAAKPARPIGLSASSFYWVASTLGIIAYKQMAPLYIPPMEGEQQALQTQDTRFTQYYYQESSAGQSGPPQVGARLPAHFPAAGIRLDATPDADNETDFATNSVHPPVSLHVPAPVAAEKK